jgi:hypothetical protein
MPIYGKTLTPPPWVLETKLNKQKIIRLRTIFQRVLRNENKGVQQTLKPNEIYDKPYLYTFDCNLYTGTFQNYSTNLEELINLANAELRKDKVFGKDYRFDIMGNWSFGNIIVMKRSDMLKSDYKKQIDKYEKLVNDKIARVLGKKK